MPDIQSNSQLTVHRLRSVFLPDAATWALYVCISIVIIFVLNLGSIISTLSDNYIGSSQSLNGSFSELFKGLNDSLSGALGGRLGQILLWAFVGALSYILIWLGRNIINSFENDIITDHYKHPGGFKRSTYWGSSIAVKVFLMAIILMLIGLMYISVKSIMPALAGMSGGALHNLRLVETPLYIISSVLGVTVDIYIIGTLVRLTGRLWKLL